MVSFRLVPASSGRSPGRVQLFHAGDLGPRLVVAADGSAHAIPAGRWLWIADAPGSVSVGSGALEIPNAPSSAAPKVVLAPVVPACELALKPDRRWQAMERLDLVSIPYATTYPLDPKTVRAQRVPVGRYLAYSTGARGLLGISRIAICKAGEVRPIAPPDPPRATEQDLLLHVTLPEGVALDPQALAIAITANERQTVRAAPDVAVWQGRRGSFFFLGVRAEAQLELSIVHPRLRTRTLPVGSRGASARELPEQLLKGRRSLAFLVDYRPARAHRSARVIAYSCGCARLDSSAIDLGHCRSIGHELPLVDGPSSLRFDNLDDGQYEIDAVIDGERVRGLGDHFAPFLDPQTDDVPNVSPLLVPEVEIYGNLLSADKPVPGDVRLWTAGGGSTRAFTTDRDLSYHLFYFAHRADRAALRAIPEDLRRLNLAVMQGLYELYTLEACDGSGTCRLFDADSTLTGGGRLDLDLGSSLGLDVQVVSAATGQAIADALVGVEQGDPALHFVQGEVEWKASDHQGQAIYTDGGGWARMRNLQPGGVVLTVSKPGFAFQRATAEVDEDQRATLRIALDPYSGSGATMTRSLRFADGSPVGQGYLLAVGQDGVRGDCSQATDAAGVVELPTRCSGLRWVLLHPEALVTVIPLTDRSDEITVDRAPALPVTVRISDAQGRPLSGVPIVLRFPDFKPDFKLGPKDLFAAALQTDAVLFYMTDAGGEAMLHGIDPVLFNKAEVTAATDLGIHPVPLADVKPGQTVELVAPD